MLNILPMTDSNSLRREILDSYWRSGQSDPCNFRKIRIFTLGDFHILNADGASLNLKRFGGKLQALLKILITSGGQKITKERVIDALWPDAEGDLGNSTFDTTLYRLRKKLGIGEIIIVENGHVSLNQSLCWIDLWELELQITELKYLFNKQDIAHHLLARKTNTCMQLYRGAFLQKDQDTHWTIICRERIQSRMILMLRQLAVYWEQQAAVEQAELILLQALDIDPASEILYVKLVQLYFRNGRSADAAKLFKKCELILTQVLGVQPSDSFKLLIQNANQRVRAKVA